MEIVFDLYKIRRFLESDVESLARHANNIEVSRFMRDTFPYPYTTEKAIQWINYNINNSSDLFFAIADEKELIGGIGAVPYKDVHRFTAEIGFWLGELHWNKGITTRAVNVFCNYLFSKFNFNRLTANVFEGNIASQKVLTKIGFKLEGIHIDSVYKNHKFINHYVYGILKKDFIK